MRLAGGAPTAHLISEGSPCAVEGGWHHINFASFLPQSGLSLTSISPQVLQTSRFSGRAGAWFFPGPVFRAGPGLIFFRAGPGRVLFFILFFFNFVFSFLIFCFYCLLLRLLRCPRSCFWLQFMSQSLSYALLSRMVAELRLEMLWSPSYDPSKFENFVSFLSHFENFVSGSNYSVNR